jgi:hypothetical protein
LGKIKELVRKREEWACPPALAVDSVVISNTYDII